MRVIVSGGAGFIGSHLVDRLLAEGHTVLSFDNFDPFYDRAIKEANIRQHALCENFAFVELDLSEAEAIRAHVDAFKPNVMVHLAAKAGVQPSLQDPVGYQRANVQGTQHLLEAAKTCNVRQFVFASSSSVYGVNANVPWREDDAVLQPISPYAATKVAGELLGHVYAHLYGIRFIALRFFTVYGPRQRPDLAIHKFAKLMLADRPISIYGDGSTRRDYTYIDDIVQGVCAALDYEDSLYEVINLGNHQTVELLTLVRTLERVLDVEVQLNYEAEKPGDVPQTYADISKAKQLLNYAPTTSIDAGLRSFYQWLQSEALVGHPLKESS